MRVANKSTQGISITKRHRQITAIVILKKKMCVYRFTTYLYTLIRVIQDLSTSVIETVHIYGIDT